MKAHTYMKAYIVSKEVLRNLPLTRVRGKTYMRKCGSKERKLFDYRLKAGWLFLIGFLSVLTW